MGNISRIIVSVIFIQLLHSRLGAAFVSQPPTIKVTANVNGRYFGPRVAEDNTTNNSHLTQQNDNTYIVPSAMGQIVIDCNASYPVMWNLAESDINSEMFPYVHVRTRRFASDLFDATTFNYSTQIILEGPSSTHRFTGNYSCQNTAKRNIRSNVFIYWEGTSLDTLVHSRETITTYLDNTGKVTLPCGISNPKLTFPKLKKQVDRNQRGPFNEIPLNKSVTYNPATGFTLSSLPNPLGVYKCVIDEETTEDIVTILVKNLTSKMTRKQNVTFTYNQETNELVCCTGVGRRAPNIFMMHCDHAVTCQYREHILQPYHYVFQRSSKSKNCASKTVRFYHTVLVRCVGDGIDEYKEMITPVKTSFSPWAFHNKTLKPKIFFSWEQIESQEMVDLEIHPQSQSYNRYDYHSPSDRNNMVLYNNETVEVTCTTSQYYFSEGNYWVIRWKNKTLTAVTERSSLQQYHYLLQSDVLSYTLDPSMEAILCFAPVWNSSVWVIKTQFLYVNETEKPSLLQNETLFFTWVTNETAKEMICESKGTPDPSITWMQGTTEINSNSHNYNVTTTSTKINNTNVVKSVLKVLRVSYSTHGQFVCTSSNYGGSISRSFSITVTEPSSMKTATILLIVSGIVVLILIVLIIVVVRVMKLDQAAIQHLSSVHFKDPATREHAVGADVANTTYDNGKWTNQLIS